MHKFISGSSDDLLQIGLYFYLDENSYIRIITLQEAIVLKCKNQSKIFKVIEEDSTMRGKAHQGYICECLTTSHIGSDY